MFGSGRCSYCRPRTAARQSYLCRRASA
jgi:hypothetical protein